MWSRVSDNNPPQMQDDKYPPTRTLARTESALGNANAIKELAARETIQMLSSN